ncbi:polysaccharide lyase family 7 protein [Amycolatopsis sp. PS_44_ISF1]|uniref:polysaccharide lyase family 7 protein n=1 Tax=Amycolatopsis sp. PS_44_ISF1 TaxID=2974917 RepID=UPI0028DE799C|nr:polysaccharide lyase family 7 protein [Amycolatopsis sp. PS_44_ISF1]MDT8915948.1 polysaccharide lyase family 7 protein [Amycolatopsis sp. PS_44_ISF1]
MERTQWIPLVAVVAGALLPGAPATAAPSKDCRHPADVLDLANWKETLPTGSKGKPTEIEQPALNTFSAEPWFTTAAGCTGVRFRAAVDGVTTSGSGYPRSELREMAGGDEADWSTTRGTSTLTVDTSVTHLPADKPEVVVAQIHDADDDVTVFRLEGSKLYLTRGDDPHYRLADGGYRLGTRFTVEFVAGGGRISAYYNGTEVAGFAKKSSGDYFKAGVYTQANCDKSSPCSAQNYGETVVYGLTVAHQDH